MLHRFFTYVFISVACMMIGACVHTTQHNPIDPYESLNRGTYGFNKAIDTAVIKPISYLYWRYFPQPAQTGIGNFFDNLEELPNIANDILQLRLGYAAWDTSRFLINSTIGLLGFFDIAGKLGLEHRKNDFGQTLYQWGYKQSAYLVIPFFGPSTFRDGIGFAVDYTILSIWPWVEPPALRYSLLAVDVIDTRARLLRGETVLNAVAIDEYEFIRDAYFQRREYQFNQEKESSNEVNPYGNDENATSPEAS